MDSDRKSAVSSFYGGRKTSLDALNSDFPSPSTPNYASAQERGQLDTASSFFNPERASRGNLEPLNGGRTSTAGYNRGSFFHTGREEPLKGGRDEEDHNEGAWDVYADFNNVGPRYSTAYGQGQSQSNEGYQQIAAVVPTPKADDTSSTIGPVEMVTVPALGPEWKRTEMREMTKAGRREKKAETRGRMWRQWYRGERGIYWPWLTRRVVVFVLFGLCAAIALVLAFTIPRVPGFAFNDATPLANATGAFQSSIPVIFSRAPANFSFPGYAALQVNTQDNFLPLTFNHLRAQVFDLETNKRVATGDFRHVTLRAKAFPNIKLPLNFTYVATNDTDQTWKNWYNGCKNSALFPDGVRPALKFRLHLDMDIAGLPTNHQASTQVTDANCPVELPINSV